MTNTVFCGFKKSGKSRAADILTQNGYELFKFATPLKRIIEKSLELGTGSMENLKDDVFMSTEIIGEGDFAQHHPSAFFKGEMMHIEEMDLTIRFVKNILIELGMTEDGAYNRIMEDSVRNMPITGFDGITTAMMLEDVSELFFSYSDKEQDITFRKLLQDLGTDVMRSWNKDIHVKLMDNALTDYKGKVVIDDARFPNELAFCREKLGADIVWLHRPSLVPDDFHESETSIGESDCEYVIKSREGEALDRTIQRYADSSTFRKEDIIRVN